MSTEPRAAAGNRGALRAPKPGLLVARLFRAFGRRLVGARVKPAKPGAKVADRDRTIAELRRTMRDLRTSEAAMRRFLAELAVAPWPGPGLDRALGRLFVTQPSLATALVSSLAENPATRSLGVVASIRIQSHRRIYGYVVDLAEELAEEEILRACFEEVAVSRAALRRPETASLIEAALATGTPARETGRAALVAALLYEDDALIERVLEQTPEAAIEPDVAAYGHVRARAAIRLEAARRDVRARVPAAVQLGFLSYRAGIKPSTNVGDYVQTIATMGLVARHLPPGREVCGGGEVLARVRERVAPAATATADARPVDVLWIDRDDPGASPKGGPIWMVINGWFMHERTVDDFPFPFAEGIRPLFLGMHVNRADMLTADAVGYLQSYGPVGTRDWFTAELLLANGIDAFFSGCATLSLDGIFGRVPQEEREGRYLVVHHEREEHRKRKVPIVAHTDPLLPVIPVEAGLEQAWRNLERYARAVGVETSLLHCYLPCRSFGTKVDFTHPKRHTDPRFEGLVGIDEEQRVVVVDGMRGHLDAVLPVILAGAPEADVYARWRDATAAAVQATRDRLAARRRATAAATVAAPGIQAIELPAMRGFRGGVEETAPKCAPDGLVDVVFCFDARFAAPARVTLRSLLQTTWRNLRVTLLTREVAAADIAAISAAFPSIDVVWGDVGGIRFDNLKLLRHTTVSTMDRVFLPELMPYADRAIYLDIDIVVLGDIGELFDTDLGGHPIGGRITVFPGWRSGASLARMIERQLTTEQIAAFRRQFLFARSLNFPCFNAGVQLMDLRKLRERGFAEVMLQIIGDYGVNDQYAVNFFCCGDFKPVPLEWNHIPTQEKIEMPKLIHFTGYIKPWECENYPKSNLWRQFVQPTDGIAFTSALSKDWFR